MTLNSNDKALLQNDDRLRVYRDAQGRDWLTFKAYIGRQRKYWWVRPAGCDKQANWKTAGQTIAERSAVLDPISDEWIAKTWGK